MSRFLYATISALLGLAVSAAAQTSAEARKAGADRGLVVTDDNIQQLIKNSRISVVGRAQAQAPAAAQRASTAKSAAGAGAPSVDVAVRMSKECGGPQTVATWCPRQIHVPQGARVTLTVVNDVMWTPGAASFILTAADVIEDCYADALGRRKTLPPGEEAKCKAFPQFGVNTAVAPGSSAQVSFTADQAGQYKFYDGMSRSGYGLLFVDP